MENQTPQTGETKKPKRKTEYKEADLVLLFKLKRITEYKTPLMIEWCGAEDPVLNQGEQYIFDLKLNEAVRKIDGWSEEDLKMQFIAFVITLGRLTGGDNYEIYFDKTVSAVVGGIKLTVKSDFMVAKGFMDSFSTPYFHFQEYKPHRKPSGDSMGQLLEAFLIAQTANGKPLYGIEIIGKQWAFVIMEGKQYCISQMYDCTKKDDLLKIIGMLRKFRYILETRLLDRDE